MLLISRVLTNNLAAVLGVTALLLAPAAQSQNAAPNPAPASPQPAPIPNAKLDAAAAAINHVAALRQSYQQQLAQAPDSEKDRITTEANAAMTKAVTDQGLSLDEYNAILDAAQNDPSLRSRLLQRLQAPSH